MSTNRTSLAIDEAIQWLLETNDLRNGVGINIPSMCLVKYKRMEEALQAAKEFITDPDKIVGMSTTVGGLATWKTREQFLLEEIEYVKRQKKAAMLLKEALDFDPLSE